MTFGRVKSVMAYTPEDVGESMTRVLNHFNGIAEYCDPPEVESTYSAVTWQKAANCRKVLTQFYNDSFKYLVQRSRR